MTAVERLRQPLERLYREFDYGVRVELDAIRFPLRYSAPRDRELVGLLAACLAYGRVDLFSAELEGVLARMGPSPAAFVTGFDPRRDSAAFDEFWYRFNRPRDLVAFCVAARDLLARFGTLERCSLAGESRAATATCSRCRRWAGRASGCISTCAGWSAESRPTSVCGRRCR